MIIAIPSVFYLDSDNVTPIDVEPWFDFREEDSKPVINCLQVIWNRKK